MDRNRTRDAVAMIYQSSLPRPYTLSNLVPATLYYCSLSARTSPGFGVEATVEVLTSKLFVTNKRLENHKFYIDLLYMAEFQLPSPRPSLPLVLTLLGRPTAWSVLLL